MVNKFFTADQHFGHENIIKFCNRPFKNSGHMTEEIISRWNRAITDKDDVYIAGDFTLNGPPFAWHIIRRLQARKIYIIPGGHDKWIKDQNYPDDIKNKIIVCPPIYETRWKGNNIVICHYPMLTWEKSHYGSIHVHGHSHGKVGSSGKSEEQEGLMKGTRIDIGVDVWDFYPVHANVIINLERNE